ncbi:MAG: hypothetical protein QXG94_03720, partial [Candidatus Bathyarchaeia archaeon]
LASPIWIGTLSPPIQEFLKKHAVMRSVIVTTSIRSVKVEKVEKIIERLCGARPLLCVNIREPFYYLLFFLEQLRFIL